MFERDFLKISEYGTKRDREESYRTFLDSIHQSIQKYPFSLEGLSHWRGRPTLHTVVSFGGYFNADNTWTVFIAYRCNNPKHTIQHAWSWDAENQEPFNYRVMEFLN